LHGLYNRYSFCVFYLMTVFDIIVVGAGPSGAMAAYEAAKTGLKVAILEKESLPRYKTCGGGLVFRGRQMLPFDLASVIEREFHSVQVAFSGSPYHFESSRANPIVTMVMRDKFDSFLIGKARELGVAVLEECALLAMEVSDPIVLKTTKGLFRANYVIAADGVFSPTAKMVGWRDDRHLIPALEYEISVDEADFSRLSKALRFDVDIIPNGYGWCFPKANHLSIGVAIFKKRKVNLRAYYLEYLQFLGINKVMSEEAHGYQIPVSPRSGPMAENGVFLTGDAAGLADPLTAEGISNAIFSGCLAGKAIRKHFDRPDQAADWYHTELSKQLLPELKTAQFAADLFYHQKRIRNLLMEQYGQRGCETLVDIFTGERRYPVQLRKKVLQYVKSKLGENFW
jgi:geranylgeranyl reductase family protein